MQLDQCPRDPVFIEPIEMVSLSILLRCRLVRGTFTGDTPRTRTVVQFWGGAVARTGRDQLSLHSRSLLLRAPSFWGRISETAGIHLALAIGSDDA